MLKGLFFYECIYNFTFEYNKTMSEIKYSNLKTKTRYTYLFIILFNFISFLLLSFLYFSLPKDIEHFSNNPLLLNINIFIILSLFYFAINTFIICQIAKKFYPKKIIILTSIVISTFILETTLLIFNQLFVSLFICAFNLYILLITLLEIRKIDKVCYKLFYFEILFSIYYMLTIYLSLMLS